MTEVIPMAKTNISLLTAWILRVCVIGMPFLLIPGIPEPFAPVRLALLALVCVMGGILLVLFPSKFPIQLPKLVWVGAATFFGMGLMGLIGVAHPGELLMAWGTWFVAFFAFLLFVAIFQQDVGVQVNVWRWLTITGLVLIGLRLLQEFGVLGALPEGADQYAVTFGNRNFLDAVMVLLVPVAWKVGVDSKDWIWRGAAVVMGLCAGVIVLIDPTSGAKLALGAGVLVIGMGWVVMKWPNSLFGRSSKLRFGLMVGLMVIGAVASFLYFSNKIEAAEKTVAKYGISSEMERLVLWDKTVEMIGEHPFLGVGPGHWPYAILEKGVTSNVTDFGSRFFMQAHNDFLQVASEWGILPGMIFLAWIIVGFFAALIRFEKNKQAESLALAAGILIWSIFACVNLPAERPFLLLLLLIQLAIIYAHVKPVSKVFPKWTNFVIGGSGVAVSALVLVLTLIQLRWDFVNENMLDAKAAKDWTRTLKYAEEATSPLNPHDRISRTPISWYRGTALVQLNRTKEALTFLKDAYAQHPFHPHVASNYATALASLGMADKNQAQLDESKAIYKDLIWRFKGFDEARKNVVSLHLMLGEKEDAKPYLSYWDTVVPTPIVAKFVLDAKDYLGI